MRFKFLRRHHPTASPSLRLASSTAHPWCLRQYRHCHYPACCHLNVVSVSATGASAGTAVRTQSIRQPCDNHHRQGVSNSNTTPLLSRRRNHRNFLDRSGQCITRHKFHHTQGHIGVLLHGIQERISRRSKKTPWAYNNHDFPFVFFSRQLFSKRASAFEEILHIIPPSSPSPPPGSIIGSSLFTSSWLGQGGNIWLHLQQGRALRYRRQVFFLFAF